MALHFCKPQNPIDDPAIIVFYRMPIFSYFRMFSRQDILDSIPFAAGQFISSRFYSQSLSD